MQYAFCFNVSYNSVLFNSLYAETTPVARTGYQQTHSGRKPRVLDLIITGGLASGAR